jgi:5-methyltetrahydrofolate--homocysteine methyltransferase
MKFLDLLRSSGPVVFDGSMGTRLQSLGLAPGACPEEFNLTHPDTVASVHGEYVEAGARIIGTNTFGANRKKLSAYGLENEVAAVVTRAVEVARKAAGDRAVVGLSVGPTGTFLEPVGPLAFADALAIFSEPIRTAKEAGADLVIIETMSDLLEVRAAAVAAKEAGLPFVITMTFEEDGRTVLGTPPGAAAAVASALGASMVGANCSLGPKELLSIAEALLAESRVPVMIQPNAGLPRLVDGATVFPTGPEEFAREMAKYLALGIRGVGGCCGTTAEHIRALAEAAGNEGAFNPLQAGGTILTSRSRFVRCGPGYPLGIIGERINPTGKKKLSAELKAGKTDKVREEALGQAAAGATLLDVNVGVPGLAETEQLPRVVRLVQNIVDCPLVLDSADPAALEAALLVTPGKPLLNSVSGKAESMERVLPMAVRYGAAVLALPLDKTGVPRTAQERLEVVGRILEAAEGCGLNRADLVVDGLTLAVGADPEQPAEILRTLRLLREELGLTTVLGVSNVSYGLPARAVMNASFLSMAVAAGLDFAIVNPYDEAVMGSIRSADALLQRDAGAKRYLAAFSGVEAKPAASGAGTTPTVGERIGEAVITGDREAIGPLVEQALDDGVEPMEISSGLLIPALEEVGERFGAREFFLPQVIGAAEAAKAAFDVLKRKFPPEADEMGDAVVIATVEGDIHDIGKNIVVTLLENHGYRIVDLGTNVSPGKVLAAVEEHRPKLIGLSALMTTTLPAMEATIGQIRKAGHDTPVVIGGAVVTEEYARQIGANAYAANAMEGVRVVKELLGTGRN